MTRPPTFLLTANLFGIPFSIAGLAQCCTTAHALAYVRNVVRTGRDRTEVSHLSFGPLTRPALPTVLVPSMAIEFAPPVVAGTARFAPNGRQPDTVAHLRTIPTGLVG